MNHYSKPPPWYRQFWPWFIITLPTIVVIASIAMVILAFQVQDAPVSKDYYQQGKAVNQIVDDINEAKRRGVSIQLRFLPNKLAVSWSQQLPSKLAAPEILNVHFQHVNNADLDFTVTLTHQGVQQYSAQDNHLERLTNGKWYIDVFAIDSSQVNSQKNPVWRVKGVAFFPLSQFELSAR